MITFKLRLTICCLIMILALQAKAEIRLPAVISDNMVLQQESKVSLWGWAKANSQVKINTSWNGKSYVVKSDAAGYWLTQVSTPKASYTPYSITVSDGRTITLRNILIGEVWLCSGQSNMEMPMKGFKAQPIEGGPEAIAHSANHAIRCFTVKKASAFTPQPHCEGNWEIAGPATTGNFTATGYYFARLLHQTLRVPIGLIHASWGGSRIEAWMNPESLHGISKTPIPQPGSEVTTPHRTPTLLFNGMIHPLIGYTLKGTIWYQGEGNRNEPDEYIKLFDSMVRQWRCLWGIGEFPFYYCQIAPNNYTDCNSAYMREAQTKGMRTTPHTGMVVLMDSESPDCIHPAKKKMAGERLAMWALAKTYHMEGIHYKSPEVKSIEREGRLLVLTFDMESNPGLTSYGKEIRHFQIAGADKKFHSATAILSGNQLFLFSPAVTTPVATRYCFDNTSPTEIFTVEGNLPLSSFRTDNW